MNLRLLKEIDADTFSRKATELRDREGRLKVEIEACDLGRHEQAELAIEAFRLSQSLIEKLVSADIDAKRRILEILWLNCTIVDVSLAPEWRKPFGLLIEGLPIAKVGTTGRLLNFLSPGFKAGKLVCGDGWNDGKSNQNRHLRSPVAPWSYQKSVDLRRFSHIIG